MKKIIFTLTLLFTYGGILSAQVNIGEAAPGFTHNALDGTTVSLSDFQGKVVYVFFYGAGCPHCIQNGPVSENEYYQVFNSDTNFVALGLDTWNNSVSSNQNFKTQTGISYTLLLNARQTLVDYYGTSSAYDRSVVIGADGILKYKGTGFINSDVDQVKSTIQTELDALSTDSENEPDSPYLIQLNQNYPNPFNPSTTISYQLDSPGEIRLQIFNVLGKEIATLVNEYQLAGNYSINWDASNIPSGIYLYRLFSESQSLTKRMMLIK